MKIQNNRLEALIEVAQYVLDDKERKDYIEQCLENEVKPENIKGRVQKNHVYAKALIALGLEFEE